MSSYLYGSYINDIKDNNLEFLDEGYKVNLGGSGKYKAGECTFGVLTGGEGSIAHFHIRSKDKKFNCCIRIFEPCYFTHGTKTDTLDKDQCKIMADELKIYWVNLRDDWLSLYGEEPAFKGYLNKLGIVDPYKFKMPDYENKLYNSH